LDCNENKNKYAAEQWIQPINASENQDNYVQEEREVQYGALDIKME